MFILINELLLENKRLTSSEKIVLCMLNQFRKANAHYWGSFEYMADKCGMSVDMVRACMSKFCDIEILVNEQNGYKLVVDPDTDNLSIHISRSYKFNPAAFANKLEELKNDGYQIIVECANYIQMVNPDKPGLIMLNR